MLMLAWEIARDLYNACLPHHVLTFWSFCSAPRSLAVFFVVVVAVFIFVPAALLLIPLPVPVQGASTVS